MKPHTNCQFCPLKDAPGPVWGEGSPHAKLIVIGQNPEKTEIDEGRPFAGGSGRILDNALYRAGIQRTECFVSNVVKCFVAANTPVPKGAVECCQPLIQKELDTVRTKTILTVGKEAFQALVPEKTQKMETDRKDPRAWLYGCPYPWGDRVIIPTVHPAFVAKTGFQLSPIFDLHLEKARRFADGKTHIPSESFNYNPTAAEVSEYVQETLRRGEFGCDIETPESLVQDEDELIAGEATPISVIGISCQRGESIGVPPDLFDLLRPLFEPAAEGKRVTMYDFNDDFDGYHLGRRFSLAGVDRRDVMLMLHHLHSNLRSKNLGIAMSLYTDIPYHKNLAKVQPELYNCRDTYGALWAGQEMYQKMYMMGIAGDKPENEGFRNSMACVMPCREMRVVGTRVDTNFAAREALTAYKTLEAYEKLWNQLVPGVDWNSPKQLMALFNGLGLPPQFNTNQKGKKVQTVDEDALVLYRDKYQSKIAELILLMRGIKHVGDVMQWYSPDGRMHPRLKIHGQVGHRIQAVDPAVQTFSEEMVGLNPREMVVGDTDEHWIMTADFSQIEWRVYMIQAHDEPGLEAMKKDIYVYGQLYEEIFTPEKFFKDGMPPTKSNKREDIPPWKLLVAKSGPLGWIYGREDFTALGISKVHSKMMSARMNGEHPAVVKFHQRKLEEVGRKGYAQSVFGRIRRFPGRAKPTDVYAFYGQTTAVDILCRNAIIPLASFLGDYGGRILFTVHDSVVVSYRREFTEELSRRVREAMESPIPQLEGYRIPVEIKVGPSWGKQTLVEKYLNAPDINRTATAV